MKLNNKVILVTGGSTGIGKAASRLLASQGARVVFTGRRKSAGEACEKELQDENLDVRYVPCDISSREQVDELFGIIRSEYSVLHAAFNNAGIDGVKSEILQAEQSDWDEIIAVNLTGTFMLVQRELEMMLPRGEGSIVNMSSVCGTIARKGRVAYNASRHGVEAITKTAALEYASSGIRVNAVAPGSVKTDIFLRSTGGDPKKQAMYNAGHPIGRVGEPDEIARAVLWLMTDAPDFMAGHTLMLDGGFTIQ
ncbi:SDR family NAD(P)-dependent oxidoreductase [Salinispira pacifica]|uniref:3-oxoacyl-[acyl-carrier protein] reductase n=1 Tax=Salinispira pacifica TaxID=1307761 RepID=V5WHC2_9SPIO|nr:SDR family oxidoreductase [Salinispira pacifica]AHC14954.1 3-oxoacyl-[acyl-carrier protein] reductase [Salinispira pacifica]